MAKSAVIDFVARVTERGSGFVPPAERVAVFDNDGTLWCEKPMPIQLDFAVHGLAERARQDPSLARTEPWRAALAGDLRWFGDAMVRYYEGDAAHARLLIDAISRLYDDLTVEEYAASVGRFFESALIPRSGRPYTSCGFLPMVQVLDYLRAHDFAVYIASGGDRDFMRPVAEKLYGVPPERVIGSALGLAYSAGDGRSSLLYKGAMEILDDGPQKPIRIWSRVGRRPIVAVGNSNGDVPMLEYAGGPGRAALRMLIKHDDAAREFDYLGGSEQALDRAAADSWTVVSVKDDWATVFSPVPAMRGRTATEG